MGTTHEAGPQAGGTGGLVVSVLGPLRARRDGVELTLGGRRQRAVLARLALAGGRAVAAERLVDELWAGEPPASATNTLQSYVSHLRRALGGEPAVIERAGDGYRLRVEDLVLDSARFEELLATGTAAGTDPEARLAALDEALALWHGVALSDLADEPWAVGDAVRLTELRLAAVEARFDTALDLGRHGVVVGELDALALAHPLRERLTALLVVALYRCGRQAEALRAYERLRTHLGEELGLDPSPELARLAAQVLDHDPALALDVAPPSSSPELGGIRRSDVPPNPPSSPERIDEGEVDLAAMVLPLPPAVEERRARSAFVGRGDELDRLRQRWAAVASGGRSLVLLEGEAGAGKTRLAQQLARWVHEHGGNVWWGRCTAENLVGYQPVVEALRTGSRSLPPAQAAALARARPPIAALLPDVAGLDRPSERAERWELFEAVVEMLVESTPSIPLLFVIDDLHWADASTIALLDHVLRQGRETRMLVVATARRPSGRPTPSLDQLVVDLRRDGRLDVVPVAGIGTDDVVALLDGQGVVVTHDEADALRDRTGGNPFFLEALVEHGSVDAAVPDARTVPPSVRDLLDERLRELGDDALQVLSAAAVVGPRVDLAILSAVVDLDTDGLLDVVDVAVASHLLVEDEELGWVGFPHALVRAALIARTTRNREARLHLRIADVVAARPGQLDREATIAQHLLAAGRLAPAVRTADACTAAGMRAIGGIADTDAREWGRRAIAALDAAGAGARADGVVPVAGGVPPAAGDAASGAAAVDARRARGEALILLMDANRLLGDSPEMLAALAAAVELVQAPDTDPVVLAVVACGAALVGSALDFPWGLRETDPAVVALLQRALAGLDALPDLDRGRRHRPVVLAWLTISTAASRRQPEAVTWSRRAMEEIETVDIGPTGRKEVALARRQALAFPAGLEERLALHGLLLDPAPSEYGLRLSGMGLAVTQLLEAGRVAESSALQADHRQLALDHDRPWFTAYVHFLDGLHAFLAGDIDEAEALYARGVASGEPGHTGPRSQFDHGLRVMSARSRGREGDLRDLAEEVIAVRPDVTLGPALLARALVALDDAPGAGRALAGVRLEDVGTDLMGYLVIDLLAEVAWLTDDAPLGAAVAAAAAPFADRIGVVGQGAVVTGPVHRPHGLALAAAGDLSAAAAALARAVAVGQEHGFRPTVGRASLERAVVLRRLGRSDEADEAERVGRAALASTPVPPPG